MIPASIIPELAESGLLLQAAMPLDELDDTTRRALADADVDLTGFRSLVLLAQAGRRFWDREVANRTELADPFDERARTIVSDWFASTHPKARWLAVYPGDAHLPLGQLAARVGWGRSSPLGLTVNPTYGLWLAHRIAFVTDLTFDQPTTSPSVVAHVCDSCATTPCVPACPVGAVSLTSTYDVEVCARHRVDEGTNCALQCLARNACPAGAEHRYGDEQMAHHYGAGLGSIVAWLKPDRS